MYNSQKNKMDIKIQAVVVTVSDSRNLETDASGDELVKLLETIGAEITERIVVTDDLKICAKRLFV